MENWNHLKQEKIDNRIKLLAIDPAKAQQRASEVLRPELWTVDDTNELNWANNLAGGYVKQTPNDIKDIFYALQDLDLDIVLVGGQAINFWAINYRDRLPELEQYLPFSSEDIDFYGGRLEANAVHQILGGDLTLNKNFDRSSNAGVLVTNYQGKKLRIDFLSSVFGLNDDEISQTALIYQGKEQLAGLKLAVLNPILCLEGKLKSLVGLPQAGRQDLKHLKMSIPIVRVYLSSIFQHNQPKTGLKLIERIWERAIRDDGLQVYLQHQIKIEAAIPITTVETLSDRKWQKFREIRLPKLIAELEKRRTKYQEIMQNRK